MVLGKFVGRSVVMVAATVGGFLLPLLYTLTSVDGSPIYELFAFLVALSLFGVLWVATGVGFSAFVDSETKATVGGIVLFIVLFLWPFILGNLDISVPDFVLRFWLITIFMDVFLTLLWLNNGDVPTASSVEYDSVIVSEFGEQSFSAPVHLQHWFVFVIIAIWILVTLGIGYYRFNTSDL